MGCIITSKKGLMKGAQASHRVPGRRKSSSKFFGEFRSVVQNMQCPGAPLGCKNSTAMRVGNPGLPAHARTA